MLCCLLRATFAARIHGSVPILENQDDQQKYDLPLVRRRRVGRCDVLRQDLPDSAVGAVHRTPGDYPAGKQGDVLTVEFSVMGIPCLGLNGGPVFKHNEAFSFQVATDDQAETDRLWRAIVENGGEESACGWCKDKWGLSWQITPRALTAAIANPDRAAAKRAFAAMMTMRKIDIATIEASTTGRH